MEASDTRRLRQVEDENRHLKKIVANHALRLTALRDVSGREKQSNPNWACQRISDILQRGRGYPTSAQAVARILRESGCELEHVPTTPRRDKPRRFEREKPCEL
jgi:transposase